MRRIFFWAALVLTLFFSKSYGQLTFGPPAATPADQPTYFGGPLTQATAGPGSESINLKVDWNWQQIPGDPAETALDYAIILFSVGPLPVQVSNLQFTANAKWVNGGGTSTDPVTRWYGGGLIYQDSGGDPTVLQATTNSLIANNGFPMKGNGFNIVNASASGSGSYVLANGVVYGLEVYSSTSVDPSQLTADDPTSVVTLEGGAVSTWPGFTASFNWQTVPEPASLVLLGVPASLCFLKRRRAANTR